MTAPLLELDRVSHVFASGRHRVTAVDDLSLAVGPGEVLCLVGESGCGKTTTGRLAAGLLRPSAGRVRFAGRDIAGLRGADYGRFRRGVQLIHQNPYLALNPAHTIYDALAAPLRRHRTSGDERATRAAVHDLLAAVGLSPTEDTARKHPHQLSGGQRQRVALARALSVAPALLIADEAVAMVDVSLRVGLLQELARLTRERGMAVLFITHDLALAQYFAWEGMIGVMRQGRLVELAPTPSLLAQPRHEYTRALLAAVPDLAGRDQGAEEPRD